MGGSGGTNRGNLPTPSGHPHEATGRRPVHPRRVSSVRDQRVPAGRGPGRCGHAIRGAADLATASRSDGDFACPDACSSRPPGSEPCRSARRWGSRSGVARAIATRWSTPARSWRGCPGTGCPGPIGPLWTGPPHPVARRLREGDQVGTFTVIETPGHTVGHVSFWREADRVLVLGDVLANLNIWNGRTMLCEPQRIFSLDPARNRRSARRLIELEPKLICFGHGPPLRNTRRFVEYVEEAFRNRETVNGPDVGVATTAGRLESAMGSWNGIRCGEASPMRRRLVADRRRHCACLALGSVWAGRAPGGIEAEKRRPRRSCPADWCAGAWQGPEALRHLIDGERIKTIVTLTAINRDDPKYVTSSGGREPRPVSTGSSSRCAGRGRPSSRWPRPPTCWPTRAASRSSSTASPAITGPAWRTPLT